MRAIFLPFLGLPLALLLISLPDDGGKIQSVSSPQTKLTETKAAGVAAEPLEKNGAVDPIDWTKLLLEPEAKDNRAHHHAHGKVVCSSGCELSNHPTAELTQSEFQSLIDAFAQQPMTEESAALETLLYYGAQTKKWIEKVGSDPLDKTRSDFLKKELSRQFVFIEYRVVTEAGKVVAWMPPTKVPLEQRHIYDVETDGLEQPITTSGTVKRVGLNHIWQRI